jgi:hypothetical protein
MGGWWSQYQRQQKLMAFFAKTFSMGKRQEGMID